MDPTPDLPSAVDGLRRRALPFMVTPGPGGVLMLHGELDLATAPLL